MGTLYGIYSAESTASSGSPDQWWLVDVANPSNSIAVRVAPEPEESKELGTVAFVPAGGEGAFYVVHSQAVGGFSGELSLFSLDANETDSLKALLESRRKLLLKRNVSGEMTYITVVGALRRRQMRSSQGATMRKAFSYTFAYVEVKP